MTRFMTTVAGALALLALPLASAVSAQDTKPSSAMKYVAEQPAGEWLAHVFFGAKVQGASGEVVGDINDLVFNPAGQITTVVLGVGGYLGVGEKDVAIPYTALSFKAGPDSARMIIVSLSKDDLSAAPAFKPTERSSHEAMRDKAIQLGKQAAQKASDLKDQAFKKVEGMTTDVPNKP